MTAHFFTSGFAFHAHRLALLLAVISLAPAGLSAQTISTADQQAFARAMDAMNRGDAATAEPLLRQLHTRHPRSFEIDESLGLLLAGEDKVSEALPLLETAATVQPASDVAHANLGTAYLKLNRPKDAVHELERAAQLNPSNAATQQALGQALMQLNQPGPAAAAYRAALTAQPDDPTLLYNTALAEYTAGDAAAAAPLLARLPGADSSAEAQSLLGDVDEKLGQYKEAAQHYANAVHLAPTEPNQYVLGIELLRHWTFGPAVDVFNAGIQQFPDSRRMHTGLGIAYYANGDYAKAIPVFADLLAADSSNEMYAELLGRVCTVLTEGSDPRCTALIDFAKKHPQNAILATYAATSILHQPSDAAQLELAGHLLASAVHAQPDLPEARYGMGLLLQTRGQWAESVPELEAAIRLRPEYAAAHYRLALALNHTGQREKAQEEIALERRFSTEERNNVEARLKQVKTLLVTMQ
ncbi:tetratricopeptide repeat protein [Silvibacterium sp.]|uniref:tetratricopeptide repeat protein n=1 Tax=Silvibacterium sp. TaxID=1964179 RepID=UPI0039E40964